MQRVKPFATGHTSMCSWISIITSEFSSNSEAYASELLESFEQIIIRYI